MKMPPNHPAPGKAEIASWLTLKAQWLGLPKPGRSASA